MTLYEQWRNLIDNQTNETFDDFWSLYSATETKVYSQILGSKSLQVKGSFQELTAKYEADPVIFMGFLDGIDTSLVQPQDFEHFDENSQVNMEIDVEKLFFNMLEAKADYLYTLPEWDDILTVEKREEITKEWKRSKTVVKEKEPGRNDPCSCGSGKKYKKCCGK